MNRSDSLTSVQNTRASISVREFADFYCALSKTGKIRLPGDSPVTLELDTSTHTKARSGVSQFSRSKSAHGIPRSSAIEPLTLEVCLFSNGRSTARSLLGRGVIPLTPVIAEHLNPSWRRPSIVPRGKCELDLIAPDTRERMSTAILGITFHYLRVPKSAAVPSRLGDRLVDGKPEGKFADLEAWTRKVRTYLRALRCRNTQNTCRRRCIRPQENVVSAAESTPE